MSAALSAVPPRIGPGAECEKNVQPKDERQLLDVVCTLEIQDQQRSATKRDHGAVGQPGGGLGLAANALAGFLAAQLNPAH